MSDAATVVRPGPAGVEARLDAFEAACAAGWPVDLDRFAPPAGDPDRPATLCELVLIDLEYGHTRGTPRAVASYQAEFPELFAHADLAEAVAFEDARLRQQPAPEPARSPRPDLDRLDDLLGAVYGSSVDLAGTAVASQIPNLADRVRSVAPSAAAALDRAASLPKVGDELLGFRLAEELGSGTFGRVFLAHQAALSDRPVALKVTARPNREAQCLARLQHANIVPVLSVHRAGELQAVCMPYYGRTTLAQVLGELRQQPTLPASGRGLVNTLRASAVAAGTVGDPPTVPPGEEPRLDPAPEAASPVREMLRRLKYVDAVVWIGARLADGLGHAHERGVLHRDLKPDNVLVADDGQPMLLDFNLAQESGAANAAAVAVGGTVLYMSPEHLDCFTGDFRRPIDTRSDLYALGLVLYELLTGRHPYPIPRAGRGLLAAMQADRRVAAVPPRALNPVIPDAVDAMIRKLLDPEPAARYQSARQLAEDFDRHLAHEPLKYAAESPRGRARKWLRRNPRALSLGGLVAAATLAVVAGAAAAVSARGQSMTEAKARQEGFRTALQTAAVRLKPAPATAPPTTTPRPGCARPSPATGSPTPAAATGRPGGWCGGSTRRPWRSCAATWARRWCCSPAPR